MAGDVWKLLCHDRYEAKRENAEHDYVYCSAFLKKVIPEIRASNGRENVDAKQAPMWTAHNDQLGKSAIAR